MGLWSVVVFAAAAGRPPHPLFPKLATGDGIPRLHPWTPTLEISASCKDKPQPKYCLHFKRRGWCILKVQAAEQTFGKSWNFDDETMRDGKDGYNFCRQSHNYRLGTRFNPGPQHATVSNLNGKGSTG